MTQALEKSIKQATPVLIKINQFRVCAICKNGTFFIDVENIEEAEMISALFDDTPIVNDELVPFTAIVGIGISGTQSAKGKRTSLSAQNYIEHLVRKGGKVAV